MTFWGSVKNRMELYPPSRPTPDCRVPPNGVRKSRTSQQLSQTIPVSMPAAKRWARFKSAVQTEAESPYLVLLTAYLLRIFSVESRAHFVSD